MTKAEKTQEEMKQKVNRMLDKEASNAVIINQVKRTDPMIDNVKLDDKNMNNLMKQASGIFNKQQVKDIISIPEN